MRLILVLVSFVCCCIIGTSRDVTFFHGKDRFYDVHRFQVGKNALRGSATAFIFRLGFPSLLYIDGKLDATLVKPGALSRLVQLRCGAEVFGVPRHEVQQDHFSSFRVLFQGRSANETTRNASSETPYDLWIVQIFPVEEADRLMTQLHFHACEVSFTTFQGQYLALKSSGKPLLGVLTNNHGDNGFVRTQFRYFPQHLLLHHGYGVEHEESVQRQQYRAYVKRWLATMDDDNVLKVLSLYRAIANADVNWDKVLASTQSASSDKKTGLLNRRRKLLKDDAEEETDDGPVKVSKEEGQMLAMMQLENKLRAAEKAGSGMSMKTIREELEHPMANSVAYAVPQIMSRLTRYPNSEAVSASMSTSYLPAMTDPVMDQIDHRWREEASGLPGVNVRAPNTPQASDKVGLADDLGWSISDEVIEQLVGGVVEKLEPILTSGIPNIITRQVTRALYPTLTHGISQSLALGLTTEITKPLSRDSVQEIAQGLIPALTLSLAPIITHSLTRKPTHDYYCWYCVHNALYCDQCRKGSMDAKNTDYYAAYYARYFSRYYTYYYGKMDSEHFDDPIPLPEKEGKGLDSKDKRR
jgi:hypothetical protein